MSSLGPSISEQGNVAASSLGQLQRLDLQLMLQQAGPAASVVRDGQGGGTGTFHCRKCHLHLPNAEMDGLKPNVCRRDVRSYKSISERWPRDRKLALWWKSMAEPEQTNWYRRQHSKGPGQKRDCTIIQEDSSKNQKYDLMDVVDRFIPLDVYIAEELKVPGMTEPAARAKFQSIVDDMQSECIWRFGQWHVPRYMGLERRRGGGNVQESATKRVRRCGTSADLKAAQASGQAMLEQYGATFIPSVGGSSSSHQELSFSADASDQPSSAEVRDVVASALTREA